MLHRPALQKQGRSHAARRSFWLWCRSRFIHFSKEFVAWFAHWMAGWLVVCFADWLVGWLLRWLVGWRAGRQAGQLAGWLAGWLVGRGTKMRQKLVPLARKCVKNVYP